ncbi:MAG: hypothetical protein FWD47_08960 [Treponema sp.]|nr:hypothetical protein [Treponema sp.]
MTFLKKYWVLIAGIIIIPAALLVIVFLPQLKPKERKITADSISVYLKDGDIICRLGDRIWSQYFKDISPEDKRFSHLGIIRITDSKITVIHAEGRAIEGKDYVNETSLDEFLEIAKAIGIYRFNYFDDEIKTNGIISSAAMEYIGIPFDWDFNLEIKNKIYCTELIYLILEKIAPQVQLTKVFHGFLKREIIPPEAVSNSEFFDEILFISIN